MTANLFAFSGVDVATKIALWEMRAETQDSPAPTRAAKRLETSRIASFENELPSGSEAASPPSPCSLPSLSPHSSGSPPPCPAIGEICHARICYYVAETQDLAPVVELAGVPPSVELPTVSLVSKPKTASESSEFKEPSLPFETLTLAASSDCSTSPSSSSTTSAPFSESAASSPSPSSAPFSVSTETSEPLDELEALDLEGVESVLDFPDAAPLSDLLWRQ